MVCYWAKVEWKLIKCLCMNECSPSDIGKYLSVCALCNSDAMSS